MSTPRIRGYEYCVWEGVRPKQDIYDMLSKVTAISQMEREKGNKEHAQLMTAMGVGLRWVLHDYDFGLEELSKPQPKKEVL